MSGSKPRGISKQSFVLGSVLCGTRRGRLSSPGGDARSASRSPHQAVLPTPCRLRPPVAVKRDLSVSLEASMSRSVQEYLKHILIY